MDNMKRKEKIGVPTMQLHTSGDQKSTTRASEKLPAIKGRAEQENGDCSDPKRRLSFKERRAIKQNNDTQ